MTDRIDLVRFQRAITTTANGTVVTGITAGANGSTSQLVLDSAGNVGIGTASPAGRLNVATGRALFGPNSELYAMGIGFNQTRVSGGQVYYLGASDATSPDLVMCNAAGLERMRVSSAGIVTTPFQSALRLDGSNGSGIELAGNTLLLTSTYYASNLSRGDLSWNSTNGRVTATTAGYYAIMYQVYVQTGGVNNNGRVQVRRNGSNYQLMQTGNAVDGTYDLNTIVQLNANDYIDMIVDTFDPIRLFMGANHTSFHMFFLG